ncbi:hypothetical protein ASPZODRAFT_131153 [Penicilliopsis zonata CBS 506.65]|uniref:Uncharacterized protein n=1 Tax=Penicilliopsis zonata CBS 506.65 TaxID=1073090 RepID=A0A1L9SK45_9EURO|nr:hypothetical protein ASPZODRAFT_131153 [Penicilliopsis zonata CBS 506.65]OJJ47609.1 hypothetical protein ASPZODRAFT_131153 [Penicilliopsis zonata CBS 506.65]
MIGSWGFRSLLSCHHGKHTNGTEIADIELEDATISREVVIDNGHRAIWGHLPLYDLLSLSTTSGNVVVTITPQPAEPEQEDTPAKVVIRTKSGSVTVSFAGVDEASVPVRPYEVEIQTSTGHITGKLLFSTSLSLESQRGSITVSVTPVVYPGNVSIYSHTETGSQNIRLKEPINDDNDDDDDYEITASHSSRHGSLYIAYPSSWAGQVHASAVHGSICLNGDGLRVTKDGEGRAEGERDVMEGHGDWWGERGAMQVDLQVKDGSVMFNA